MADSLEPIRWLRRKINEDAEKDTLADRVTKEPGGRNLRTSINKHEDAALRELENSEKTSESAHPLDNVKPGEHQEYLDSEHRTPGYTRNE